MCFKDQIYSHTGKLNKTLNISYALDFLDSIQNEMGIKSKSETDTDFIKNTSITREEAENILGQDISKLSKEQVLALMSYMTKQFGIKL